MLAALISASMLVKRFPLLNVVLDDHIDRLKQRSRHVEWQMVIAIVIEGEHTLNIILY